MTGEIVPLDLKELQVLEGHTDRVWAVAWSPNGSLLASCSGDKTVRIWAKDPSSRCFCKAQLENHTRTVRSCEWSPCGKFLATASFDNSTQIWEYAGGEFECLASLEGHENEVKSASWSASGSWIATCSRDKSVWVWSVGPAPGGDFECASVCSGHSQDVKTVRWHPTRDLLVSASYDDSIKVWAEEGDGDDWHCVQTLGGAAMGHMSTVWSVSFDARGDRMVSCSDDLTLKIWDTSSDPTVPSATGGGAWKHMCTISGYHDRTIFSVDWSSVNGMIASGGADDCIRVFQEDPEESDGVTPVFSMVVKKSKAHPTDVNCVRWHPKEARWLASAGDDGTVRLWELVGDLPSVDAGQSS